MAGWTTAEFNAILDFYFGGVALTPPATLYWALFTVAPTDAGGGTEISTGVWTNYARVSKAKNQTNWPAASGGAMANGTAIDFGTATVTGTAPVAVAIGAYDASTAGNLKFWKTLSSPVTINNGSPVSVPIGDGDLTKA